MKLFIGNLSYDASDEDVKALLAGFAGFVSMHRPMDRETGKPRGFAFATYETREDGEAAMDELAGMKLDGRELSVNEAEERRRFEPSEGRRVSMKVDVIRGVDDRPLGPDGKKVRYKGI